MEALRQSVIDTGPSITMRTGSVSPDRCVLGEIYQDLHNIVIWRRELSADLIAGVDALLKSKRALQVSMSVTPQNALVAVREALQGYPCAKELSEDVNALVEMFGYLFDIERVGLRLAVLNHAMCPRFHVDRVLCRLVTTYQGTATEWLPHHLVDRSKLGHGNNGLPDELSGIYQSAGDIQRLNQGDVALIKGELWEGNENAGLVHRSPSPNTGERRLVLTLDFLE